MIEIHCTAAEVGLTVLELLQQRIPQAPPSYLRQILKRGKVRLQGSPTSEDTRLAPGDRLLLPASGRLNTLLTVPLGLTPHILYEDPQLLAVFKPAGLAVHRGVGQAGNLADWVQAVMRRRGEKFRTAPAHRLDAGTSGPVLFGKGKRGIAALGAAFREGAVEKIYLGLASGRLDAGVFDSPVWAKAAWREARTEFARVAEHGPFSLLEIRLHSGRTHQIRQHLAEHGHPLAGDQRYGGAVLPGLSRLFLHCRRLAFSHPLETSRLVIESPLPEDLVAVLKGLSSEGRQ